MAEDVQIGKDDDDDDNDEAESLFDNEGNLKNRKDENVPKLEAMNKK